TGSTSGIGREIAKGLLVQGYTVIAHGRSAEKSRREVEQLKASTGSDRIHTVLADLSLRSEVKRMAKEVSERFPRIDRLVHNAAVVPKARAETPEGLDGCFATNVLAPFLLTRLLEDHLRAAAPSRVLYFWGGGQNVLDLEDLQSKKTPYSGWNAYCQSKNACALLVQESAKRLSGSGISVFAVLPGLVNTEGMLGLGNFFSTISPFLFRTPAQGARTPLWIANEPGLEAQSGKCFGNLLGGAWRKETKLMPNARDPMLAARVYAACEQLAASA
ncbi:MAG TPA: SDR family NAD(P)-dependent oxidoreductase, partial [Myxococcaceae bacterium]